MKLWNRAAGGAKSDEFGIKHHLFKLAPLEVERDQRRLFQALPTVQASGLLTS